MAEETKKHRKVEEIQGEYQNLCLKLGHMTYQIRTLEKEAELLNNTLRDLNLEAAASHAADQKAKEQEEAAKKASEEGVVVS